jgi:hypothetical protein
MTTVAAPAHSTPHSFDRVDWPAVEAHLDEHGWAICPRVLGPDGCRAVAARYDEPATFRSHVVMARHGFGRGEYKYFAYPLPEPIAALRAQA